MKGKNRRGSRQGKKNSSPYNIPRRPRVGVEVWLYSFSNLGARWRWVIDDTIRPLYPRARPGPHCIGGWVGPRAGLDGYGKISSPTGVRSMNISHCRHVDILLVRIACRNKLELFFLRHFRALKHFCVKISHV